jgi:hypothetical protein
LFGLTMIGLTSPGKAAEPKPSPEATAPKVSRETKAEILKMEDRLRTALETRDASLLEPLLVDSFTDFRGGERALSKRGAMMLIESGKLVFFAIDNPRLTQSVDAITIEGSSSTTGKDKAGKEERRLVHVKRSWARKDGKWLLAAQSLTPVEEEHEERK